MAGNSFLYTKHSIAAITIAGLPRWQIPRDTSHRHPFSIRHPHPKINPQKLGLVNTLSYRNRGD